jgi:hypothetical protein
MKNMILISSFSLILFSNIHSQGIPYNQEFQVNTYTTESQVRPVIAGLKNGNFVVCWESVLQDSSGTGVYGQLFDASIARKGTEFKVNTYSEGLQQAPSVAALTDSGFIVCWGSNRQDLSAWDILGQFFSASGGKRQEEFCLNSNRFRQGLSCIAGMPDGSFVVCWERTRQYPDIYGQVFNAAGEPKGNEFLVNTSTYRYQTEPSVAVLRDGGFVICWKGEHASLAGLNIFGQLFDAAGSRRGEEFLVNTSIEGYSASPSVAALSDGGFVVCWEEHPIWEFDIYGQIFSATGVKSGPEFLINTYTERHQRYPCVAGLSGGRFVVCWQSEGQDGSENGVFGQLFDSLGNKIGGEFQINSHTKYYQGNPAVVALKNGGFVVCWESYYQEPDEMLGIRGKCFVNEPIIHQLQDFSLIEPENDASLYTFRPTFCWQQPSTIRKCYPWEISFDLYIDTDSNFPHPEIIKNIQDTTSTIDSLAAGKTYFWKVLAKNLAGDSLWCTQQDWGFFIKPGATSVETAEQNLLTDFELFQNYPNPFNSSTEIKYFLPHTKASYKVQLKIYDVLGRVVKVLVDQEQFAGSYAINWDGTDLNGDCVASGIYFYNLETRDLKLIRKMLVLQ